MDEYVFTPEEAKAIYAATTAENYNFRKSTHHERATARLVDQMRRGEWRWWEASPIRLSSDRRLCSDGLHRLLACGISGIPLRSFVLVGDQYAAGAHTDKNLKRTVAQVLVSQGLSQGSARGAMTVGHLSRLYADLKGITQNHARTVYVHEEETIDFAHKHEALTTWAISRYHGAADRGFNGTGYSVFLFEAASADRDMAELFHQAVSGTTESEDDPIHRLRQYQWRRFDTTGRRMSQPATVDAFVKCWNHVLAGDRLKVWKPPLYENIRFPDGFRNPLRGLP